MTPLASPASPMQRAAGLMVRHPQWLLTHAEAYLALVALECDVAWAAARARAGLAALALVGGVGAVLLAGVAVMLTALLPAPQAGPVWLLVVVPAVPGLVAGICVLVMHMRPLEPPFVHLRKQVQADLDLLREAGAP